MFTQLSTFYAKEAQYFGQYQSMKTFIFITLFCLAQNVLCHESRSKAEIQSDNDLMIQAFFNSQDEVDQVFLNQKISMLRNIKEEYKNKQIPSPMRKITQGEENFKPVLLFIQGLPQKEDSKGLLEWMEPILLVRNAGFRSYFHSITMKKNVYSNTLMLRDSINELKKIYPHKEIIIFGYSAGGVVALKMLESYNSSDIKLTLHTIASPVMGYNAPKFLSFFKSFTFDIGLGVANNIEAGMLRSCQHHVTTKCDLDIHACKRLGTFPQIGPSPKSANLLPCGPEATTFYPDETHSTVLAKVIFDYINL